MTAAAFPQSYAVALKPQGFMAVFERELRQYFDTPLAYVLLTVFLLLSGMFSFYMGGFYDAGQADLDGFFRWHPWLYLFFIPAVSMRLWAEEHRQGTVELLLTLPISTVEAVAGKFCAAFAFIAAALLGTLPMWWTVNYLGDPDNLRIAASYLGSLMLASCYIAAGMAVSGVTRNQVIAFVLTVMLCFLFIASGFPIVLDFFSGMGAPQALLDTVSYFSFVTRFEELTKGLVGLGSVVYFVSFAGFWLTVNYMTLNSRHAG